MKGSFLSVLASFMGAIGMYFLAKSGVTSSGADYKAITIAVVSAYILFVGTNSFLLIASTFSECAALNKDLLSQEQPSHIKKLEHATTSLSSCSLQATRYVAEINQAVSPARWFAAASVYFGLFGTILGLSFAVIGLKNLGSDTQEIKNQILAVVSGFGGSFACAACGIFVTVVLVRKLASLDDLVEANANLIEIWLQKYIHEKTVTSDNILEKLTEQFGIVLKAELAHAFSPLQNSSNQLSNALSSFNVVAESIVEESQNRTTAVENLKSLSNKINNATDKLEKTSVNLATLSETLAPVATSMQEGTKLITDSIAACQPLFVSAKDLADICNQTNNTIKTLQQTTAGLVATIRDTQRQATQQSIEDLKTFQSDAIIPIFTQINESMQALNIIIHRSDELIRQLPMSVEAGRILDDLRIISAQTQTDITRDASTVTQTVRSVEETQLAIKETLNNIRGISEQMQRVAANNNIDFNRLSNTVNELTEEISKPFWKKLGDRKG
jgi:hypothetical protein